jgi:hypothetical protein
METKEIDGIEYVKKSEVENIIKQRVDKVASRANEAELANKELQSRLEKASKSDSTIDLLTQQIETMKQQLTKSEQKYTRFQAMSKHGLVDPDIVDAIEWSYEKSQAGKKKGEVVNLGEWLDSIVTDPTTAPTVLRPHLQNLQAEVVQAPNDMDVDTSTQNQLAQMEQVERRPAPQTNNGVRPSPEPSNLIERGLKDADFYAQNRDEIRKAWMSRRRER